MVLAIIYCNFDDNWKFVDKFWILKDFKQIYIWKKIPVPTENPIPTLPVPTNPDPDFSRKSRSSTTLVRIKSSTSKCIQLAKDSTGKSSWILCQLNPLPDEFFASWYFPEKILYKISFFDDFFHTGHHAKNSTW